MVFWWAIRIFGDSIAIKSTTLRNQPGLGCWRWGLDELGRAHELGDYNQRESRKHEAKLSSARIRGASRAYTTEVILKHSCGSPEQDHVPSGNYPGPFWRVRDVSRLGAHLDNPSALRSKRLKTIDVCGSIRGSTEPQKFETYPDWGANKIAAF